MSDNTIKLTPSDVLKGESPLVLIAHLQPVAGLDRFQPAGFPEVGHVIYKAPRVDESEESVCIVDSPASMANHLESVCLQGAHDYELVDELTGMPYVRCVTGTLDAHGKLRNREVVVVSLTEGHRLASTYFLQAEQLTTDTPVMLRLKALKDKVKKIKAEAKDLEGDAKKEREREAKKTEDEAKDIENDAQFQNTLIQTFGIELPGSSKAHPPAEKWWNVFKTIFQYDPNSLVHGVLFPQWQIKIPRFLTAHLEAFGASRVDRSGVKFDRLGKTTSGQPIFAVDDAVAREIRATFILDVSLLRSFGRTNGDTVLGLNEKQKEFLVALALWKIQRLLATSFRFRSGCHLRCAGLFRLEDDPSKKSEDKSNEKAKGRDSNSVHIEVDIVQAIKNAGFIINPPITDVYWPREELYRKVEESQAQPATEQGDGSESDYESED